MTAPWLPHVNPYRLVALDIGNTLIRQNPPGLYRALGLPESGKTLDLGVEPFGPSFLRFLTGLSTQEEYLEEFYQRFQGRWTKEEILQAHREYLLPAIPGMPELVEAMAKTGTRFVFFSDINPIHFQRFRDLTPGQFDFIVDAVRSDQVHALKPAPEMFRAFEERFGVPDLYLDDRKDLVEAATRWGWHAVQAGNPAALREILFP
ncbi:MAG: HAD family hydrolase [Oligosphaeraceae bacterium]